MRRTSAALALVLSLPMAWAAPASAADPTQPGEDACALLTADEASGALGETMAQADSAVDQCIWSGDQGTLLNLTILPAQAGDETPMLDRRMERSPDAEAFEVGGYPALYEIGPLLGVPSVYVYPSSTVELELELVAERELDAREPLVALAELALPRLAAAAPAPTTTPGASQAAAAGLCALLTADEVAAALGGPVTANDMPPLCIYAGDLDAGSLAGVALGVVRGQDLATAREQAAGWAELTVAGASALQAPTEALATGLSRSMLLVLADDESGLFLSADASDGVDVAAAAVTLAELAVPRLGSLPLPSTTPSSPAPSQPGASAEARTGLAALFPAEVGGTPTTIDRAFSGREFLDQIVAYEPMEERVTKALRRRDRRVRDLSFVIGGTASGSVIAAFQVQGGPIRPLVNVLLESLAMERTGEDVPPDTVAGKDAFEILGGFLIGGEGVAYPKDDALWFVFSSGDEQAEIFERLP